MLTGLQWARSAASQLPTQLLTHTDFRHHRLPQAAGAARHVNAAQHAAACCDADRIPLQRAASTSLPCQVALTTGSIKASRAQGRMRHLTQARLQCAFGQGCHLAMTHDKPVWCKVHLLVLPCAAQPLEGPQAAGGCW